LKKFPLKPLQNFLEQKTVSPYDWYNLYGETI